MIPKNGSNMIQLYGDFLSHGCTPSHHPFSIIFMGFFLMNHPAIGVPPWPWKLPKRAPARTSPANKSQLAQHPRKSEVVPAGPPPEMDRSWDFRGSFQPGHSTKNIDGMTSRDFMWFHDDYDSRSFMMSCKETMKYHFHGSLEIMMIIQFSGIIISWIMSCKDFSWISSSPIPVVRSSSAPARQWALRLVGCFGVWPSQQGPLWIFVGQKGWLCIIHKSI